MSLEETIKELKEQIAKEETVELPVEEIVEEAVEEPKEEPKPEEEKKEEPVVEVKAEEEPKDGAGWARLRREAAAATKKAELEASRRAEAEAKLAELQNGNIIDEAAQPIVDPEIEEVKQTLRLNKAEREFQSLESKFRSGTPEYDAVSAEYARALAQSIKIQNPRMSNAEVGEETKRSILMKAAKFMRDGFDPIEELYHEAKELGFTGASFKQKEEPKQEQVAKAEEDIRPDMKKLAANRAKSTGMTGSTGKSEGQMTQAAAADLPIGEWAKLPASEKRRLLYG